MMFWILYLYELKKIFSHRIKLLVLLAVAAFLSGSFAGETETKTDALIYSSKYGHIYAVGTKLTAGCTFSLIIGILLLLMTHIPVIIFSGLHGLDAPWYMVMPFSELSIKAGHMLLLHTLVFILGCVLSQLRYLTPITVLLNTNVPDMRLTKIFSRYLISFQTAPILYVLLGMILIIITVRIFRRRYR